MNTLLFFALCSVLAVAAALDVNSLDGTNVVRAFAGTLVGSGTYYRPNSNTPCATSTNVATFTTFNTSFETTGVREVIAMADKAWDDYLLVYLYNDTFDAANPCNNLVTSFDELNSYGPEIDDYFLFQAGLLYTFVVTSSSSTAKGGFALNILEPTVNGNLAGSATWTGVNVDSSMFCSTGSTIVPYFSYSWVQENTGRYDVMAAFSANATLTSWGTKVLVYSGSVSADIISGTNPCNGTILGYTSSSSSRGATVYDLTFTATQTYTVVLSGAYANSISDFGLFVYPTRIHHVTNSGFTQPSKTSYPPCSSSSNTNSAWYAISFNAPHDLVLFDTFSAPSSKFTNFDTIAFAYSGSNTGSSLTSPDACGGLTATLVNHADTGSDPLAFSTTANTTYSIVISNYYGGSMSGDNVILFYVLTGNVVGFVNNTAAPTSTPTSTPTTASATTTTGVTTSTTTNPTSNPTSNPTTNPTTNPTSNPTSTPSPTVPADATSGVSAIQATFVFVVLAIVTILC